MDVGTEAAPLTAIVENRYLVLLPHALEGLANLASGLEDRRHAARILGAAERVRGELGIVAWEHQNDEVAALSDRIRTALGDASFEQAFAEGQALSIDDAIAYVRRARGTRNRPQAGWDSLTPTEREVVRHAADGLTNQEIAARMFISRGTVKIHLTHIYAKLGIRNRSELAVAAARRTDAPEH